MKKQQKRRLVRVFWLQNVGLLDLAALGEGRPNVSLNHFGGLGRDQGQRSETAASNVVSGRP